eukprot:3433431-Rhodomonas_salina.5
MEGCSLSHNDYALWAWDMRVRHPCDVTSALYDVTCGDGRGGEGRGVRGGGVPPRGSELRRARCDARGLTAWMIGARAHCLSHVRAKDHCLSHVCARSHCSDAAGAVWVDGGRPAHLLCSSNKVSGCEEHEKDSLADTSTAKEEEDKAGGAGAENPLENTEFSNGSALPGCGPR